MGDDVERKGLGTPATRADIIEKLVKDGFVKREKKQMIPTEDGMKLITVLPDVVKSPQLTADWDNALTLVSKGEYSMQEFMDLPQHQRGTEVHVWSRDTGSTWQMPEMWWRSGKGKIWSLL